MRYDPLLAVRNLSIAYPRDGTSIREIHFSISKGKVLGLAGESGSGKSSICKAILGLLPPGLAAVSGEIDFMGRDIL
ncbi:MAG TPA: ATP-binding cassette domain-containing protein, partial [Negativicutes bacterium]|nr:ATP-binding cassette domain-containing protein [Negativicutes bacterium]